MKDFIVRNKVFIIVLLVTCALIVGGIFLMSGKGSTSSSNQPIINSSILLPDGVNKTSGYVNGVYLPASPSATVALVEFGDYVCPACKTYSPIIKQLLTGFAGQITYSFRNYPLSYHTNAPAASYAVEAAGLQGKYYEMQEKMYSSQDNWVNSSDPTNIFIDYAKGLGLNIDQFTTDMQSKNVKDIVQKDTENGNFVRINETPTFYFNGIKISLTGDPNQIKNLIEAELSK